MRRIMAEQFCKAFEQMMVQEFGFTGQGGKVIGKIGHNPAELWRRH